MLVKRSGAALPLSRDHKPNAKDEQARISRKGGSVVFWGVWRVEGILAVSRAIGDRMLKQFVIAEPEFREHKVCLLDWSRGGGGLLAAGGGNGANALVTHPCPSSPPHTANTHTPPPHTQRTAEDAFVVMASDGLWDVLSNEEVAEIANSIGEPGEASKVLCETAMSRGSTDNICVLCIDIRRPPETGGAEASNGAGAGAGGAAAISSSSKTA